MLPRNHPSLQPRAPFWGAWITELAWHVQWYCYAQVAIADAVKLQLQWPVSTACYEIRIQFFSFFITSPDPLAGLLYSYCPWSVFSKNHHEKRRFVLTNNKLNFLLHRLFFFSSKIFYLQNSLILQFFLLLFFCKNNLRIIFVVAAMEWMKPRWRIIRMEDWELI